MPIVTDPDITGFADLLYGGLYLGLIAFTGYAALCACVKSRHRSWFEVSGLSFACGGGLIALVLFGMSLAGITPNRWTLICMALLATGVLIHLRNTKRLLKPSFPVLPQKPGPLVALGGLAVALMLISIFSVSARTAWPVTENIDAFAIWLFKAKLVAVKPLMPIPAEFHDPTLSFSHQDYPLCFPFLVAGLWAAAGRIDDGLPRFLLLPIYFSLILVVYSTVRRHHRISISLCITAIFTAAPLLTIDAGFAVPETFLILSYVCALSMMLRWFETGERGDLLLTALFMSITAFTKNEGLALLPVIGLATLIWTLIHRNRHARTNRATTDWFAAASLCVLTISPWLIYRAYLPKTHEDYGSKLTNIPLLLHNLPRLGYVLPAFADRLFNTDQVGPQWYLLVLIAILAPGGFRRGPVLVLWSILLVQLCLYITAFMVTPWDMHQLLPMVTSRLLTQASPPAFLLLSMHLREMRRSGRPSPSCD